jgi:hypothetical protein
MKIKKQRPGQKPGPGNIMNDMKKKSNKPPNAVIMPPRTVEVGTPGVPDNELAHLGSFSRRKNRPNAAA